MEVRQEAAARVAFGGAVAEVAASLGVKQDNVGIATRNAEKLDRVRSRARFKN